MLRSNNVATPHCTVLYAEHCLLQDDLLPAADRVKYHIDKKGQNFIDKDALSKWMEEAAVASQIGQDYIPFAKETKGENWGIF